MRLPSYKSADCCKDVDCLYENDVTPCWGQVTVVDESYSDDDWWWIHACEGHSDMPYSNYKISDRPEDNI